MYCLKYSSQFKTDLKKYKHDKRFLRELELVLNVLSSGEALSVKYHNHKLLGSFNGCSECHIRPDVLLIYAIENQEIVLYLLRIGSHAVLFGK